MATTDTISLLNAGLADRYLLEREVGAGGMAWVFLARDRRHDRAVAVKVLRPELGAVLGKDRFLSEISVTAKLQHPNLLPLFDSGEAGGLLYYVMPFVEGESLQSRLEREKQLRVDDAVRLAISIAEALDYAHRNGVVHRDLKPANVLLHEGQPVVADFGIALAVSRAGGDRATQTGLSLGTPNYMSPEQASGDRSIDARSDVYSLGVVLFEMLVGEPPHTGRSVQSVLARVVTEPARDVRLVRPTVPEHVAEAIACALEKLPADRWGTAHEFAEALRGRATATAHGARSEAARPTEARWWRAPALLALAMAAIAGAGGWAWASARHRAAEWGPVQFSFASSASDRIAWNGSAMIAIAPDARATVYTASAGNGSTRLMVRRLSEQVPHEIPGTVGAVAPFFSADGRFLFYGAGGKLVRSNLDGGERTEIATVGRLWRGSATVDRIVFSASATGAMPTPPFLATVPVAGGELTIISRPDTARGERAQVAPLPLPDGRHLVYSSVGSSAARALTLLSLDGRERRPLGLDGRYPLGFIDGHLVYVRQDGVVAAAPIDVAGARTTGAPIAIGDTISRYGSWIAAGALATNGSLVYERAGDYRELTLVDQAGGARLITEEQRRYREPRFSPDGSRILVRIDGALWTYDIRARNFSLLRADSTTGAAEWSPSGRSVYYSTRNRAALQGIWSIAAHGGEAPQPFVTGEHQAFSFSADGRWVAYTNGVKGVVMRSLANGSAVALPGNDSSEIDIRLSPEGRLLAYTSQASGKLQVYVRPVATPGPRVQVSSAAGGEPRWSPDGAYLYFRDGQSVWRAKIDRSPTLTSRAPERLFPDPYDWDAFDTSYDLSPDGRQFLMLKIPQSEMQITMVLNWSERLRSRLQHR